MSRLLIVIVCLWMLGCRSDRLLYEGTWEAMQGRRETGYFLDVRQGEGDIWLVSERPDYYYHPVSMTHDGDSLHWTDTLHGASFSGKWDSDSTFSGMLIRQSDTLEVQFIPTRERAFPGKPQEPVPPYPYMADSVVFSSMDTAVMLAGTLSYPQGEGPFPAVVLVSGSGAQDRDCAISGHKPFLVIADHLTRNGYAVLRYDDRGYGLSTGDFVESNTDDFALDVAGAARWLAQQPTIDTSHITLIGHSEGGLMVPLALPMAPQVDGVVLLAAPAVGGVDLLIEQNILLRAAMNATPQSTQMNAEMQQELFGLAIKAEEQGWSNADLKAEALRYLNSLPDSVLSTLSLTPAAIDAAADQISGNWFRRFLTYDPVPALQAIRLPVLAIFGSLDLQVPPHQNRQPMERALRGGQAADVTVMVLPQLNHLMQTAHTGSIYEYFTLEETTSPILLDSLTRWLDSRAKIVTP